MSLPERFREMPPNPPRRFAYYDRLSAAEKRTYRRSDLVGEVPLPRPEPLRRLVGPLRAALEGGEHAAVARASGALTEALVGELQVSPVRLEVLESRPRGDYGELHGLYTYEPGVRPLIQVWMRTAARAKVVAWRTYLRTLLHEVGHHLDLHLFDFEDTFHTQGFYRRENHLFQQLTVEAPSPPEPQPEPGAGPGGGGAGGPQLSLPGL